METASFLDRPGTRLAAPPHLDDAAVAALLDLAWVTDVVGDGVRRVG